MRLNSAINLPSNVVVNKDLACMAMHWITFYGNNHILRFLSVMNKLIVGSNDIQFFLLANAHSSKFRELSRVFNIAAGRLAALNSIFKIKYLRNRSS